MSGVIDNGVQWEHCNGDGKFFRLDDLGYEKPSKKFKYGRMLCVKCVDAGIRSGIIDFNDIVPAKTWEMVVVKE